MKNGYRYVITAFFIVVYFASLIGAKEDVVYAHDGYNKEVRQTTKMLFSAEKSHHSISVKNQVDVFHLQFHPSNQNNWFSDFINPFVFSQVAKSSLKKYQDIWLNILLNVKKASLFFPFHHHW